MPFIRPIEVDLSGGEAATSGGILCSSDEADANAELIGDHGNDEVGDHPNSDDVGDHGNDEVEITPKMSWEALTTSARQGNSGSPMVLDAPQGARWKNTCRFTGHTGLGANFAFEEGLPRVLSGKENGRGEGAR